jgi:predicted TIM-barrel fold metal-dependent hydrolase
MKIIDVNASFGFWPSQPFPYSDLQQFEEVYARNGVDEVWVSAVESILFPDPDVYDFALFDALKQFSRFRAVKTVNPLLANWQQSCERAIAEHDIKALKLYPNYQGYTLNHRETLRLCEFAAERDLPILISMRVNDERNQPTCLQVRPVDCGALVELAHTVPQASFIALCAYNNELGTLIQAENILADIAFIDEEDPLLMACAEFPVSRLVFGSHGPFLYPEAAVFKATYSQIPSEDIAKITSGNLRGLARGAVAPA